ncbi:Protein SLG1 [Friedmanniomyces endolithicus]|nr:WSC domain [Friedmanniomyces endolithicus]KAK0353719.1 Protein SLG1 [Friedmanniomyces endolithicus]KAK0776239.1 Protein SLG1 [Friedmanniomyces endolithicus]KAK0778099.1 Protein SLG1 [Friedmanniomyces endolithicus]KAK0795882.1 Protein SLG1 [Friedmanniomyces endolithicus]
MPSTLSTTAYAASILACFTLLTSAHAHAHDRSLLSRPPATLRPRQANPAMTYQACYSSSAGLTDQGSFEYQTSSYCQNICVKQNQAVLGLSAGSDCWCGDTLPPASSKVDDSSCNKPCNGYGSQMCGGIGFYSIFLSGTEQSVPNAGASASSLSGSSTSTSDASISTSQPPSSSTPSTTATPSVVTSVAPGQTVIVTQPASEASSPASSTPTPQPQPHTTNVAGIAAGVVIGVVAVAAIIGGLVFWLKRRKQQAAEDEYKRSTQVNAFMRGAGGGAGGGEPKPPPTAYSNMSDSRLDPTAGNRNSAGSIADAEDYSRRILRVANPDGS